MAGLRVEWSQSGHFDSFEVYRSSVSTSISELTTPLASNIKTMFYLDTTVVQGSKYYYRIKVIRGSESIFSAEYEAIASAGDEFWNSVELIIFAEAATYPSSVFKDRSNYAKTISTYGLPKIVAPTGLTSSYDGGWIEFPSETPSRVDTTISSLGNQDFTYEQFVFLQTKPTQQNAIFSIGDYGAANSLAISVDSSGNIWLEGMFSYTYIGVIVGSTPIPLNTRCHICLMRKSGVFFLFLNGVRLGFSEYYVGYAIPGGQFSLGNYSGQTHPSSAYKGYASSIRLTKGIARYPQEGFLPPTTKFPTSL